MGDLAVHDVTTESTNEAGNGIASGGELLTGMVLGHPVESLEKVLSPGRWAEGKKFEVCLDGCTFVGFPVFAPEGGEWVVGSKEEKKGGKTEAGQAEKSGDGGLGAELRRPRDEAWLNIESGDTTPLVGSGGQEKARAGESKTEYDFTHMPDSLEEKRHKTAARMLGTSMESSSTNSNTMSSTSIEHLTMFQVVFVMRPEQAHSAARVYRDLAKPLGKALHYCQKQSGYVATEARKMLAMKAKVRQQVRVTRDDEVGLWKSMLEGSELAWAIKEIWKKISKGEAAEFRLGGGGEMSLFTEAPLPLQEDFFDGPLPPASSSSPDIRPTSALLLTTPASILLSSLPTTPTAAPLAHLLPSLTSTKSLQKLSLQLTLPIATTLHLARHLLTHRKALLLSSPLHWRNTYVVSPSAPLDKIQAHMEMYKALFPTLPSLGNMLKVLSGRPIRYALLVPSRDHRGKYLEILEWLWRYGWVAQLKTYGWLYVPKEILREPVVEKKSGLMGLEGRLREVAIMDDDDSGSVSSERTAIAIKRGGVGGILVGRSKRASDATQVSITASSNGTVREVGEGSEERVLVKDPAEEKWLGRNLRREFEDDELRDIVTNVVPLLDGECAFEEFAARLGVKRGRVEEVVEDLERRGWLRTVKSV
jgi:hypothetical protein